MSHALQGGQAPDQASSGRQTGAAVPLGRIISQGTHTAASHPTSHKQHGRQPGWQRPQTDQPAESHSHPSRRTQVGERMLLQSPDG